MMLWQIGILMTLVTYCGSEGYCSFPEYTWTTLDDGRKHWLSSTEYLGATALWDKQDEIVVRPKEITVIKKTRSSCERRRRHGHIPCSRKDTILHINCLVEELDNKYRVHIVDRGGGEVFSCMRFTQINENILQIQQAIAGTENEDKLCQDESLLRQPWLWILPSLKMWSFCPAIGGFDFRTENSFGKKICANEPQPSRLESECIIGDSITFYFPRSVCSPFDNLKAVYNLLCWGSWVEQERLFVLLGEYEREPRYVLSLPKDVEVYDELTADLFLNAIAPLNMTQFNSWQPHMRLKLTMLRSQPGTCYDESERCREIAAEGRCMASNYNRHANMCRQSCGMCELAPSADRECIFPTDTQGDWLLFSENERHEITIVDGEIVTSILGHYTCKGRLGHDLFKVMSSFTNGCRPRYTCLRIWRGDENILYFQISKSSLEDTSSKLCNFANDVSPLGDFIHSATPKVLLPLESMFITDCHLGTSGDVDVIFSGGHTCTAYLSDVDRLTCEKQSSLSLEFSDSCRHDSENSIVFTCIASVALDDEHQMLVTEVNTGDTVKHICWKVWSYKLEDSRKALTSYVRRHCDTSLMFSNITAYTHPQDITHITVNHGLQQDCGEIQDDTNYDLKPTWQTENMQGEKFPPQPAGDETTPFVASSSPNSIEVPNRQNRSADTNGYNMKPLVESSTERRLLCYFLLPICVCVNMIFKA